MKVDDVAIIGAGPAGITAAIQLKRSGFDPVLFEKERAGGLLLNANRVENFPGFPEGISGSDLVGRMVRHMNRFGIGPVADEVHSLRRDGEIFRLETTANRFQARMVVIASGTEGIVPDDLPLQESLLGRRIFCELIDSRPSPGCNVAIIGGGDCAFDYALNLVGRGFRVSILHRGDTPGALPLLVGRARRESRIDYLPGVTLKGIEEAENGMVLHLAGAPVDYLEVEILFLAVGRRPSVGYLSTEIASTLDRGEGVDGLYRAGDVHRGIMRQVGIAIGDGLLAAMDINTKLNKRKSGRHANH